jgi:deoxyribodipyrimidine photo-lyase
MVSGLQEVHTELTKRNITFWVTTGEPKQEVVNFVKKHKIGAVVSDFNPLRIPNEWRNDVAKHILVSFVEVDAHNIVPCWVASDKEEYAAYTFRPKIHRQLAEYLVDIPRVVTHDVVYEKTPTLLDWQSVINLAIDDVPVVDWLTPGTKAGKKQADNFIANHLGRYAQDRNDPNLSGLSNMSPYVRFGQVSAQWLAMQVYTARAPKLSKEAYLEELIVRRELSDNFCFYNQKHDLVAGAHDWAQKSIAKHQADTRERLYTQDEFEGAETHDALWNAMQNQMVRTGKLHGWCRMYWAKKILEWTPDTQTAIDIALYLNDKYELDGRDPNGVVGVMWSICGVHDRAWTERPVFGKIRYMNFNGAKRKFDVAQYIATHSTENVSLFDE